MFDHFVCQVIASNTCLRCCRYCAVVDDGNGDGDVDGDGDDDDDDDACDDGRQS